MASKNNIHNFFKKLKAFKNVLRVTDVKLDGNVSFQILLQSKSSDYNDEKWYSLVSFFNISDTYECSYAQNFR